MKQYNYFEFNPYNFIFDLSSFNFYGVPVPRKRDNGKYREVRWFEYQTSCNSEQSEESFVR